MKKIALLLALLMIVGCFAACGEDSEKNSATDPAAATGGAAGQENTNPEAGEVDLEACPSSDDGKHHYTEEVAGEPSCALPGLVICTCNDCGYSTTREIPALGHQGTGASCEEPSVCIVCGEVAEEAWGHEPDGGVCKNCGIDLVATDATVNATEATTEATTAAE